MQMKKFNNTQGRIVERYDYDYNEFVEEQAKLFGKKGADNKSEYGSKSWTGTNNFEEAVHLGREGWNDAINVIGKLVKKFDVIGKGYTFSPIYDVSGESVDVGRYMTGEPECMLDWEVKETTERKIVDIYYTFNACADVDFDQLMRYGASILAMIDYLESMNVRVNLYGFDYIYCKNNTCYLNVIKLKAADEPLNIPVASFAMCNISMLRRLVFKWFEHKHHIFTSGYGSVLNATKKDLENENDHVVVLNNVSSLGIGNFKSDEATIAYIDLMIPRILNEMKIYVEWNEYVISKANE